MVPDGVAVVSALHTISAKSLRDLDTVLDEDVLLAGDRRADKARVAALLDTIDGLRCVDCGRLEMARLTEQLTALTIAINVRYKTHAGVKITGLPDELWPAGAVAG
jgi:predicted dinucleotide-binding enzyme